MNNEIEHIVMAAGSYKGLVYIGILEKLIKKNKINLNKIKSIHGCSVGSVIGLLMNLNIEIDIIKEYIINYPVYSLFKFKASQIMELYNKMGIYDIDIFYNVLSGIFKFIGIKKSITLKQLYNLSRKDFFIYSFNINTRKLVQFSHKTHPNMKVVEAIYMSSTIPIVFRPIKYRGDYYLDGTMGDDFPIDYCLKCVDDPKKILGIVCVSKIDKDIIDKNNKERENENENETNDKSNILTLINKIASFIMDSISVKRNFSVCDYNIITITMPILNKSVVSRIISNDPSERKRFISYGNKLAENFIS